MTFEKKHFLKHVFPSIIYVSHSHAVPPVLWLISEHHIGQDKSGYAAVKINLETPVV